jgi:hypothetical protein
MDAMTAARAKAPTLAWLLTALTCLLTGMAVVESRHQAVALPVWAPVAPAVTTKATAGPATTADATPTTAPDASPTPLLGPGEDLPPARTRLAEDALTWPAERDATLRLERLTLLPGTGLPPVVASGWTILLVETGALSVRNEGAVLARSGLDPGQFDAPLSAGERLVIPSSARYSVRNDGATPAVALVVTVLPVYPPGAGSSAGLP